MKKIVFTPRELTIIATALHNETSRTQFPVEEVAALLEKFNKEPRRYTHLDWFGHEHDL